MAAATKNRNTPTRAGLRRGNAVGANVHCFAGAIAVLNAAGYCVPATTALNLRTVGRFAHEADNTGGADGDETVEVERGIFRFDNAAADLVGLADVGKRCYLVDDQTVAKTDGAGTRSVAGFVDDVDDHGVWVLLDPISGAAA